MTKRKIIKIDEDRCNGCGLCVPDCPEGALQIIDGKACLVGELLCDGLGACIKRCPQDAITIEEREAEEYNEKEVIKNVAKGGEGGIAAHLRHLKDYGQEEYLIQAKEYLKKNNIAIPLEDDTSGPLACGCPGTMMKDFRGEKNEEPQKEAPGSINSQLRQWPVQLQLLNPHAPYFKNADLLIVADCVPFAYADFHRRFLKDKTLIMFCPKLDTTLDIYLEKLISIIRDNDIKSITVVKMEVPCCSGTVNLLEEALRNSGKNIVVKEYTISLRGDII